MTGLILCLILSIVSASGASAYAPADGPLNQIVLQQSPQNSEDKSDAPISTDRNLYVPSCMLDTSLTRKKSADGVSNFVSPAGNSDTDTSRFQKETGSERCQS